MTRIKIKNQNGEWETMPIIKGEPGEKGIPGEKGEKGDESYPIGTIVEYDGDTIPSGFELVEDNSASVIVSSTEPTTGEEIWIQRGKNLFNPNTDVELIGNYRAWNNSGNIISNSGYDGLKMQVKPNTIYSTDTDVENGSYNNLCYFDENMTFLSSEAYSSDDKHFTTPNNCTYVTIAILNTYTWFKLEEGTSILSKKIHTKTNNGYEEFYNEEKREIYSTEEVRIGTWIDGKPLYRKAGTYKEYISSGTLTILTGVGSKIIDRVTKFDVMCRVASTYYNKNQDTQVYVSTGNFCIKPTQDIGEVDYIVEYTKTTD